MNIEIKVNAPENIGGELVVYSTSVVTDDVTKEQREAIKAFFDCEVESIYAELNPGFKLSQFESLDHGSNRKYVKKLVIKIKQP